MASAIIGIVGTVLTAILPIAVKLIGNWLDMKSEDVELKKKFYDFVSTLENSMMTPARLRNSAARQRKRLDDMLAEIDKKEENK
jgi:hypothetical protein